MKSKKLAKRPSADCGRSAATTDTTPIETTATQAMTAAARQFTSRGRAKARSAAKARDHDEDQQWAT